ncbi:MAG: hypothetical protein HY769_03720 [Candidatus Stahlbacteria bacterium]|nr:hypothetical protein [Candidatus Stahlbacteria bacterium]
MRKLILLCIIISSKLWASPIIGPCATPLTRQTFKLTSHTMYMNFTEKWSDIDTVWYSLGKDSSYMAILSLWELYYGFENIFTIRMSMPLNYQQKKIGEKETIVGVGDMVVDAKYCIFSPVARELTYAGKVYPEFSAIGSVRLPTGGKKDTPPPVARWLGKGSADLGIAGLVRVGNGIGAVHGMIGYWYNGLLGEDREDEICYNFTIEGPKIFNIVLLAEIDGSKIGRYHYLCQVCPGIQYIITYGRGTRIEHKVEHAINIEASFPIPVEAEGGYKYKFAPYTGITWTF